jgi:polyferredoxin
MEVSVLPDRNPLFVTLSDGGIRNGYTVKISNKSQIPRRFKVDLTGIDGLKTSIVGFEAPDPVIEVGPSDVRALKIFASLPAAAVKALPADSTPLRIVVTEVDGTSASTRDISFRSPAP